MKKSDLFTLIKSMSKAEKRHFKLTSSKYDKGSKNNYLRLFDIIEKMEVYNDDVVCKKFSDINISYTKNYLFNALLKSLRDFHSEISEDALLKDMMRDAEILFRRGLYDLCYSILLKAKEYALQHEKFLLLLEIIECERKVVIRMDNSEEIRKTIHLNREKESEYLDKYNNLSVYRDLSRKIFIESRKNPAPFNSSDLSSFEQVFLHPMLQSESKAISFEALFNFHNALSVYYHATANWEKLYEQRKKLVDLFESKKARDVLGHDGMFVSLNNYVVACTCYNKHDEALQALEKLKAFSSKIINFNKTHFTTTFTLELSILLYLKKFQEALNSIQEYLHHVDIESPGIPSSQLRILHFAIGYIHFANNKPAEALKWLSKILYDKENTSRPDLYHYACMLSLIIHLDIGELEPEMIKRSVTSCKKAGYYNQFESIFLSFATGYIDAEPGRKKKLFIGLQSELLDLFEDQKQARVLHYFDILSWIESKLKDKPLLETISAPSTNRSYSFFPEGFSIPIDGKKPTKEHSKR